MKDKLVNAGDKVSWIETYRAAGHVVTERLVWGEVERIYYHPGSRDGHGMAGVYVVAHTTADEIVSVLAASIVSVQRT